MASFVAEGSQAFLSGNDDDDDSNNLAALDSMTTSGMNNNQSAFMSQQQSGGVAAPTNPNNNIGGSEGGGELGESLFDRIRRRTEEQQRQQKEQQQQQAATTTSQQPSAESSMELGLEREPSDGIIPTAPPPSTAANTAGNAFDAAVQSVENRNATATTENTYSFTATTGEDFSFQPTPAPSVPTYGPSRNDPAYYSGANNTQQYPASFQAKAAMALNDAGSTIQSLFGKGMAGASSLVTSAQERMSGSGSGGGRGGYNNNFLLREDSDGMEQGGIGNNNTMMQPPIPPPTQTEVVADSNVGSPGQAYSMVAYAKTFCEDLYGFFMQLPPLGKGAVVVVLLALWLLMRG
jgi:hypothetical protein